METRPIPDHENENLSGSSLLGALLLNGEGGAEGLDWKGVRAWKPGAKPLWVHLDRKAPDAQRWLRKRSGLSRLTCDALLAEETRPRAHSVDDGLMVILRGVNLNPGEEPDDMISVRIWVDAARILTLRAPRLLAVGDIREQLEAGHGPVTSYGVLVAIVERLAERMAPVLANLDDQLDAIEEAILEHPDSTFRRRLSTIRHQAINLRRYIAPQREAIQQLQATAQDWIRAGDREKLREAADRTTRYIESLDALRERASIIQEEIAARQSEQMNRTMYVLSVVAGIFLPLGFITGLLGINVGGMPGVDNPFAFGIVCLILSAIAVGCLLAFRRMKLF